MSLYELPPADHPKLHDTDWSPLLNQLQEQLSKCPTTSPDHLQTLMEDALQAAVLCINPQATTKLLRSSPHHPPNPNKVTKTTQPWFDTVCH